MRPSLSAVTKTIREKSGALYEVSLKANRDELLDYDKPLNEQSEQVKAGLERAFGGETTDPTFFRNSDTNTGDWLDMAAGLYAKDKKELSERLRQAGIAGIEDAAKAIAKPDDYKALANQYRVNPETGSFDEEVDIAQLGVEGRLTEEDAAVLADAQAAYDDGAAYGEALKSVAGCLI
jgi:hypothetical protein